MATNTEYGHAIHASDTALGEMLRKNWGWFLFRGLLAVALGIVALLFPISAVFAFTLLFAAFAFVDGIASIISGITGARRKEERWWAFILRGIVGVAVGLIFVVMPVLATLTYAIVNLAIVAAWSIITGLLEVIAAIKLRKVITGEWLLMLAGIFSLLLGVAIVWVVLNDPVATFLSVAWLIGLYALAAGTILIVQALRLRRAKTAQG
jgi:uncharacterized membrane protein HdeD (DUF308 family)